MTITLSTVGVSAINLDPAALERQATHTADRATCRAVNTAIVAFVSERDTEPASVADVASYLDGDISAYHIVRGRAAGPGCPDGPA